MKTVKEILEAKHKEPTVIGSEQTMLDALLLMAEAQVGAVMVVQDGALVGVVSERDFARKVALNGITSASLVKDVMTVGAVAVTPAHTVEECMALMLQKHFRHLPVLEDGTLLGVITVRDVVKATLDEKEYMIDQLVGYISGR
jgi:CBS domain-containing protein